MTFAAIHDKANIHSLSITILADNAYYSTPPQASTSHQHSQRFRTYDVPIPSVNKTGLGSSAALVTALVAGILQFCNVQPAVPTDSEIIHRLSQAAHCAAQGKVGSGFDVASAVYGSCVYRRFSPSILDDLSRPVEGDGSRHFCHRVVRMVDNDPVTWDHEINLQGKLRIPRGLKLVMCDVDQGSQTPGMVKKVLRWRADNGDEATRLWTELQLWSDKLAYLLSQPDPEDGWAGLSECIKRIRRLLRDMSVAAQVPIEPPEQTELLDACSDLPGVIGGVVPGAGGYDAVVLLIEDRDDVIEGLKSYLNSLPEDSSVYRDRHIQLLNVKGDVEGWLVGNPIEYSDWNQPWT